MLPTYKPTKLIYVIRVNVTSHEFLLEKLKDTALSSSFSRDIVNVRKEIAWWTEYFMRNENLLFGLLSYHVKNVL